MVGNQRVRARRSRTAVTEENAGTLQFLDLMNSITPSAMDETEKLMLSKYTAASNVTKASVSEYSRFFPAKAVRNMLESGVIYELA